MRRIITVAIVLVVLLVGFGVYWYLIRDDAPAELGLSTTNGSQTTSGDAPASLDGTWTVATGDPTQAGLRIKEKFVGGTVDHTAVGRTKDVTGSITVAGTTVSTGEITVNLGTIEFSDSPPGLNVANRSAALRNVGLETAKFPNASFKLTKPMDFGEVPAAGKPVSAQATGELTLHGTTKTIIVPVQAQVVGDQIEVATAKPATVALADYNITKPKIGPVADVSDTGSFEFQIRFDKS